MTPQIQKAIDFLNTMIQEEKDYLINEGGDDCDCWCFDEDDEEEDNDRECGPQSDLLDLYHELITELPTMAGGIDANYIEDISMRVYEATIQGGPCGDTDLSGDVQENLMEIFGLKWEEGDE